MPGLRGGFPCRAAALVIYLPPQGGVFMFRHATFGLLLVALSSCTPPQSAPESGAIEAPSPPPSDAPSPTDDATNAPAPTRSPALAESPAPAANNVQAPAGADAAINAWARKQFGDSVFEPIHIFYGDFSGDGAPDALAMVLYAGGGNSANVAWPLFRNDGGQMALVRIHEGVYGDEPRNVVFTRGRITLTTRMPRPDDPRCCPSGSQNWTINTN